MDASAAPITGRDLARRLSDELRHPERWEGSQMEWNYDTFLRLAYKHEESRCGSCGCAIGLAASMPEFQALGFGWADGGDDVALNGEWCIAPIRRVGAAMGMAEDVAEAIFDFGHATLALSSRRYVTPQHVADLIDRWLAGEEFGS